MRLAAGVVAGIAFAASFHLASVAVARGGLLVVLGNPVWQVELLRQRNEQRAGDEGFDPYPVPDVVSEPSVEIPAWVEPFWAGLSAAFGQAIALWIWFVRPTRRRTARHARGGAATGLMWVGLIPIFLNRLWLAYVTFVARGNYWGSAYGEPGGLDPFMPLFPFGATSGLLVLVVAFEPWRGPQFEYRCGWLPAASVAITLGFGAALFFVGRWFLPTAV